MTAMFETEAGSFPLHTYKTRSHATNNLAAGTVERHHGEQLAQLLRNERRHGPADRDRTVATQELIPFKGPFIYVHDMNEKFRPILVRDYPKVEKREDGIWPQFRSAQPGRCPFVDDSHLVKRQEDKRKARNENEQKCMDEKAAGKEKSIEGDETQAKAHEEDHVASRTRAASAREVTEMQPPVRTASRGSLVATQENVKPKSRSYDEVQPMRAPKLPGAAPTPTEETGRMTRPILPASQTILGTRSIGGEPLASGMQQSNITSAIRSQMISSTAAAAPGVRAGTNKEVLSLKRKILEKQGGSCISANAVAIPALCDDTGEVDPTTGQTSSRAINTRTQQKLRAVNEAHVESDEEAIAVVAAADRIKKSKPGKVEKEPKPGYCENCRDKFDDFDAVSKWTC